MINHSNQIAIAIVKVIAMIIVMIVVIIHCTDQVESHGQYACGSPDPTSITVLPRSCYISWHAITIA